MSTEPAPRPLTFPARPIPARATLRRTVSLPDYLPARMLNEFVYCPRLFFYEWVDGVFKHSSDTEDGAFIEAALLCPCVTHRDPIFRAEKARPH